ncbi:MAG: response regulator [bacterium]
MSESFTILIIEDNENIQAIYKEGLCSEKRTIKQVFSAEEALAAIKNECRPDLIILDIELPKMNGIEFLNLLFKEEHISDVPVFVISGHNELSVLIRSYVAGATRYFKKPIDMKELMMWVEIMERKWIHLVK